MPRRSVSTFVCIIMLAVLLHLVRRSDGTSFFVTGSHRAAHALVPGLVPQLEQNFIDWGAMIAGAFVIASLAVAIHRWVLLNDVTDSWLLLRNRRDVRFALWLSAAKSLFAFLAVILTLIPERPRFLSGAFAIATIVCVPIALSRVALVFPAIAVDRKDILNASFKLTRRHTLRILSKAVTLFVVVILLVVIPFFPARVLVRHAAGAGIIPLEPAATIVFFLGVAGFQLLLVATLASMGSLFLQNFADENAVATQIDDAAHSMADATAAPAA